MNNKKKYLAALCAMLSASSFAAENDTPALLDSSRVHDLDEVVVVSQPKEIYRLRQQPLSSMVLTSAEITNLGAHDLRDVSLYVPSFVMPNYGSRYTSSMYVRGIGSRINSPALSIYMDGMPILSKSAFNVHLYDVDRVDVLRGPQGTLYGMNAEGGLVRIYSKNPLTYHGTDIRLGIGTHFYRQAELAHYMKLNSQLALSLAGFYNGQNGFYKNQATGKYADKYNEAGGKMRMIWQPNNNWSIDYISDYQFVSQNGFPYGLLNNETGKAAFPNTNRQGTYRRNIFNTGLGITYHGKAFDLNTMTTYQYLRDYMLMDIDYLPQDYMHMAQYQKQNSFAQELSIKSRNHSIWHWTFGVIYSVQGTSTESPVYFDSEMNAFLSKKITDYAYYGMLKSMAARMGEQAAAAMIARMGGCSIDMQVGKIPGRFRTPQANVGLYHESNIDLTERLTATLGLRYDHSRVGIDYATSAVAVLSEDVMGQHVDAKVLSVLSNGGHQHFNQLLPKIGIRYTIDNHHSNVYATVSKGYRAGGYNIQMFSDILQTELQANAKTARGEMELNHTAADYANILKTISFAPETSWNYEAGTHLNLFNNLIHFDFSAFFMQVRNQQLSVMAGNYGFGRMMVNAGKSYSCGVEAALRGSAFDNHLSWSVSYGFTRAVFKEYDDSIKVSVDPLTTNIQYISYKDKKVPYVPMHTFAANIDYRFDILRSMLKTVVVGINVAGQGKTYWDEANTYSQKLYATLGAHVDFNFGLAHVSFWGKNLTDTNYNTFAVSSEATGEKLYFAQRGNPFQCGVDVKFHF